MMNRFYVLFLIGCFLLSSCSINNRIKRTAQKTILKEKVFENAHTGISIYDPLKESYLYDYQGYKYFIPASNTKLLSCYAAMKYLGDSLPGIQYQILNDTTVLIKGTGDPTILHPDYHKQPVFNFLKKFRKIEVASSGFDDFLGNGWAWDDYVYAYSAPRSEMPLYGNVVRIALNDTKISASPSYFNKQVFTKGEMQDGFSVTRKWNENEFIVTKGSNKERDIPYVPFASTQVSLLADTLHLNVVQAALKPTGNNFVYTQPLDSMLTVMMHRSDNFFAEQSLLMVSEKLTGKMDVAGIIKKLLESDFAKMPQRPRWADGSGLSPYNLITPNDFVFILNKLKNDFGLERLKTILPTGGTGTLSSLYKQETGKIFAKTGTISGVVTLSGYLITRKNRLLIFSVLVNNHNGSPANIRKGVERFLREVRLRN